MWHQTLCEFNVNERFIIKYLVVQYLNFFLKITIERTPFALDLIDEVDYITQ